MQIIRNRPLQIGKNFSRAYVVVVVLCQGQSGRGRLEGGGSGRGREVAGAERRAAWPRKRPLQQGVPTGPRWTGGWGKRDN